ncbi:MAG: hypothetical protein NT154_32865 [Verrucomicrobia bacterium]|nr:hypothetical protein [Verrucomicrobiota bacterium]
MKELDVPKSGKRANSVSYRTRFGQITRQLVVPHDPRTAVQVSRRAAFGRARFLWGKLDDVQRAAWNDTASGARFRPGLNPSGSLSGYLLFVKINCNLAAIGSPMVSDPPELPLFGANPVGPLIITNIRGEISIKLRVFGKPTQQIIVLGVKPCSQGITYVDHFTILGLAPNSVRGVIDITALYVAKYGVPRPGMRVFIRTMQQINGWQELPKQISAIVRGP